MTVEQGIFGEEQLVHQARALGALVSTLQGRPTDRRVAELVEGWTDIPSASIPGARDALASDGDLASFLATDISPYL